MNRRFAWAVGFLFLSGATVKADAPNSSDSTGKIVEEIWEAAHLDGVKIGSVHTTVRTVGDDDKRLRATVALELTFKRHNATVQLRMERGDEETAEGVVVGVFMRQYQDQGQKVALSGALEDDGRMHVQIDGGRIDRRLRWSDEIIGVHRLDHLFEDRKPGPGGRFAFPSYQPTLNAVVPIQVAVKDEEIVPLAGGRKSLLRVELRPDKIDAPGLSLQLPTEVWWLDGTFIPVRRQIELEGLGLIILTRTTRELATSGAAGRLPDLNQKNLIPLNRLVPRSYATRGAVYRVTVRDDPEPETAFVRDDHQDVVAGKDGVLELHVHPVRPGAAKAAARIAAEFLESCHFIDSDDARIKDLARKAAGLEKDPWKIALRIERWVKQNMRPDDGAALGPASQVARELRGDCRGYALLTAALCRAESIPSRTAVGLIYVEKAAKPYFGFHMWTEVNIDGRWIGLDSTLGRGGIGAEHIKVAENSWHNMESLTPLLPVNRILGKTTIEIVSVEAGE
jgi:transglutaminase-like putative cysteine protease